MKNIYLAGGWFTPEQEEEHTRLYNLIKDDFNVFNPRLQSLIKPGCDDDAMTKTLIQNITGVECADLVLVIYDGKDTGTIWEAGCAYANKKPIIYYAETLNGKPFNLMLAKTGRFAADMQTLTQLLNDPESFNFKAVDNTYKGEIE